MLAPGLLELEQHARNYPIERRLGVNVIRVFIRKSHPTGESRPPNMKSKNVHEAKGKKIT